LSPVYLASETDSVTRRNNSTLIDVVHAARARARGARLELRSASAGSSGHPPKGGRGMKEGGSRGKLRFDELRTIRGRISESESDSPQEPFSVLGRRRGGGHEGRSRTRWTSIEGVSDSSRTRRNYPGLIARRGGEWDFARTSEAKASERARPAMKKACTPSRAAG